VKKNGHKIKKKNYFSKEATLTGGLGKISLELIGGLGRPKIYT
jgi:hypothetical protein